MALTAPISCMFFGGAYFALAAPVNELFSSSLVSGQRQGSDSESLPGGASTSILVSDSTSSSSMSAPSISSTVPVTYPMVPSPPTTSYNPTITTFTVTEAIPETITITAPPVTITETLSPSTHPSQTLTSSAGLGPAKMIWAAPPTLTDLSSFQVSKLAGGADNMRFVANVPARAQAKVLTNSHASDNPTTIGGSSSSSTLIQLFFPAGSIDPGQTEKPQGGTQFYASPVDLSNAKNVTLEYSVFFPDDFDWVLAGKLPGLYGGHTGCSGGNAAIDCFSTRLMWREKGAGELYLYAPKDKQTTSLCDAEGSACNAEYGLSIGRGSFTWKRGGWTTIKQTVVLNTPGKQDGAFTLHVNNKTHIHRDDVFYREDVSGANGQKKGDANTHTKIAKQTPTKTAAKSVTTTGVGGGLLGPLLGGLLGGLDLRDDINVEAVHASKHKPTETSTHSSKQKTSVASRPIASLVSGLTETRSSKTPKAKIQEEGSEKKEVKFAGIFFSTFFGGHDEKYATPKDQYIWLKDFAVAYNA